MKVIKLQKYSNTKLTFDEKLREFLLEKNYRKFNSSCRDVYFSDGSIKSAWFYANKDYLFNQIGKDYDELKKQYKEYKMTQGRSAATREDRLKEFLLIDDLDKFNGRKDVRFQDGVSAYMWFDRVGKKSLYKIEELKKQYEEYQKMLIINKEKKYQKRLREFEQDSSNDKFKPYCHKCIFSDGINKGSWFLKYKDRILSDKDDISISIQNQYVKYKKKEGKTFKSFEERLIEFEQEESLDKFKQTGCTIKFKDGTNQGAWFSRNHDEIEFLEDNELCISILTQYDKYLNLPENWKAKLKREENIKKSSM